MSDGWRVERQGARATIWIDRPPKMNTITVAMRQELPQLFRDLEANDAVRVVVVRGGGSAAFSAFGLFFGQLSSSTTRTRSG